MQEIQPSTLSNSELERISWMMLNTTGTLPPLYIAELIKRLPDTETDIEKSEAQTALF